jgi:hypothetical protein
MVVIADNAINVLIQPDVVELNRINVPVLGAIEKWETSEEYLKWDINVGGAAVVGEAVTVDVTDFSGDNIVGAALPIGAFRLRSSFYVDATKYAAARFAADNGSPDELHDLFAYSSKGAQREILRTLGQKIFSGTGIAADGGIVGLESTVATSASNKSTVTYAGLAPGTYGRWTSLVATSFGALTRAGLRGFESDLREGETLGIPSQYTHVIMSPTTATLWLAAWDETAITQVDQRGIADLGYGTPAFNGRPVVQDPNVADGTIHFVDLSQVRLYTFAQGRPDEFGEGVPVDGLNLYMKELPSSNPERAKIAVYMKAQLQLRDRTGLATIKGVTAPA